MRLFKSFYTWIISAFILFTLGNFHGAFNYLAVLSIVIFTYLCLKDLFVFPKYRYIYKGFHRPMASIYSIVKFVDYRLSWVIEFDFRLHYGWNYLTSDSNIYNDISKLFGVSVGMDHHFESYRLGINFQNKEIPQFYEYNYVDDNRIIYPISLKISPYNRFVARYEYDSIARRMIFTLYAVDEKGKNRCTVYLNSHKINSTSVYGKVLGIYIGGRNARKKKDWTAPHTLGITVYKKVKAIYHGNIS